MVAFLLGNDALAAIDDDLVVGLGHRMARVVLLHALPEVGVLAAKSGERAAHFFFQRMPGPDTQRVRAVADVRVWLVLGVRAQAGAECPHHGLEVIEHAREADEPTIVLQRSRPAAYIVSPERYERDQNELTALRRQLFLAEVREAEAEYDAGDVRRYEDMEQLLDNLRGSGARIGF